MDEQNVDSTNEAAQVNQYPKKSDYTEAAGIFNCWKNRFFWLVLLCLLVTQTLFWLGYLGRIDMTKCSQCSVCPPVSVQSGCDWLGQNQLTLPPTSAEDEQATPIEDIKTVAAEAEKTAEKAVKDVKEKADTLKESIGDVMEGKGADLTSETGDAAEKTDKTGVVGKIKGFCISACAAMWMVKVCNFILIFASVLYCLTLLMTLKISLVGRLFNLCAISSAFMASLILVVLIVPWQTLLPGVVTSVMYMPAELLAGVWEKCEGSLWYKALYFLRFTGMWLLGIWFLVVAQLNAGYWKKANLPK